METTLRTGTVQPHSIDEVFAHLKAGGVVAVPSYTRWIVIDQKTVDRFAKVGSYVIKEDGDGYRIKQGKGSVYILPGQLKFTYWK